MGELYGEYNTLTNEWHDGLASSLIRAAVAETSSDRQWVVFDGPVDAIWIENMNTGKECARLSHLGHRLVQWLCMALCTANNRTCALRSAGRQLYAVSAQWRAHQAECCHNADAV
jgi:hypothetical protein